ncbi:MAG: 50S ribosomal protein L33 [bacterium]|nr:50S ribosomal protein L33 [bacterium]
MAKKGSRIIIGLVCKTCSSMNYVTEKNKVNTVEPLALKKYCKMCNKATDHKEKKKLD